MATQFLNMNELPDTISKNQAIYLFKNFNENNRHKLILGNLRLAANEVIKTFKNINYDKNELFEIAIIGLIKAVDSFDITKEAAFSTFAKKCIDNEILKFLDSQKRKINTISLNTPISSFENIEDTIRGNEDFTDKIDNKSLIISLLGNFTKKERQILILYFGLFGNDQLNEVEIAKLFGMTQGGVSHVIINALKAMKKKLNLEEKRLNLK